MSSQNHAERAHSKYSASGAERWFNCSASVELSEGLPDKSSPWAEEGTLAHEVLEATMRIALSGNCGATIEEWQHVYDKKPQIMIAYAREAADFILGLGRRLRAEVLVETRIYLKFIHPEMFGTFDGAVLDHFGTLHVFDYKYGAGHAVSPKNNLQMIFYAIGLAHLYDWNFKRVRVWIIQPRIKGYNGPLFWELSTTELREYVPLFEEAVERVETDPQFNEGSWCHWCKAKTICPLKRDKKMNEAKMLFSPTGKVAHGKEENDEESFEQEEISTKDKIKEARFDFAKLFVSKEEREEKRKQESARKEKDRLEKARRVFGKTAASSDDFY